jgi:hypothetical protein
MPGEGLALRGDDQLLAVDQGAVDIEDDEFHEGSARAADAELAAGDEGPALGPAQGADFLGPPQA